MTESFDVTERAERQLAAAAEATDQERLELLEELYQDLEGALDRDVDQTGPPRH